MKKVIEDVQGGFPADGHGKKIPVPSELADREWRADPHDGLRPFIPLRTKWTDE
jgi:hypothetical protein